MSHIGNILEFKVIQKREFNKEEKILNSNQNSIENENVVDFMLRSNILQDISQFINVSAFSMELVTTSGLLRLC